MICRLSSQTRTHWRRSNHNFRLPVLPIIFIVRSKLISFASDLDDWTLRNSFTSGFRECFLVLIPAQSGFIFIVEWSYNLFGFVTFCSHLRSEIFNLVSVIGAGVIKKFSIWLPKDASFSSFSYLLPDSAQMFHLIWYLNVSLVLRSEFKIVPDPIVIVYTVWPDPSFFALNFAVHDRIFLLIGSGLTVSMFRIGSGLTSDQIRNDPHFVVRSHILFDVPSHWTTSFVVFLVLVWFL